MVGLGIIEIIVLFGIVLAVIAGIIIVAGRGMGAVGRGHATLNCPHCGVETRTNEGKCDACGKALV
jgi:hypothetical protein